MKNIIDPNELIKQIPELAKAYMDLCFTAAQKNDGCYVWLDEDGEDWWLNIQTSLTKPVHIDKGFKIFPVETSRYTAVGKFFTAISEAMDFIVHYKPTKTYAVPTKTYAVDVHWDVAKTYYIEASSLDEAIKKMEKTINAGEVCVWTDGFEATDDVEVECHVEGPDEDNIQYD